MEPIITITTTTDKKEVLEEMGRSLLKQRLIACIQVVGPIKSLYWWKGNVEEASEWLGIMKSRKSLYPRVEAQIRILHAYEVPEIVAIEASDVLPAYGDWVRTETGAGRETGQETGQKAGRET
jgi:periplasmic divalent cation tolerance protein